MCILTCAQRVTTMTRLQQNSNKNSILASVVVGKGLGLRLKSLNYEFVYILVLNNVAILKKD